jgi:hypothetical protein
MLTVAAPHCGHVVPSSTGRKMWLLILVVRSNRGTEFES